MFAKKKALIGLGVALFLPLTAVAGPSKKDLAKRDAALKALEAARKEAVAVIFDREKYPDENHGRAGQKLVDEKVEAVRKAWDAVGPTLEADVAALAKAKPKQRDAFLEKEDPTPWESLVRSRWLDGIVMKMNAELGTKRDPLPAGGVLPLDAEREQIKITNEYRMLMGRHPLAIDTRLVACARAHSEEMTRLNYFSHTSPTKGLETSTDRAAKQGMKDVAIGENICEGYDSAKAAFDGWFNSSGHHRNMLDADWTAMGTGRDKDHWTQDYAAPPKE